MYDTKGLKSINYLPIFLRTRPTSGLIHRGRDIMLRCRRVGNGTGVVPKVEVDIIIIIICVLLVVIAINILITAQIRNGRDRVWLGRLFRDWLLLLLLLLLGGRGSCGRSGYRCRGSRGGSGRVRS